MNLSNIHDTKTADFSPSVAHLKTSQYFSSRHTSTIVIRAKLFYRLSFFINVYILFSKKNVVTLLHTFLQLRT